MSRKPTLPPNSRWRFYQEIKEAALHAVNRLPKADLAQPLTAKKLGEALTAMRAVMTLPSTDDQLRRALVKALRAARQQHFQMDGKAAHKIDTLPGEDGSEPLVSVGKPSLTMVLPLQEQAFVARYRNRYGGKSSLMRAGLQMLMRTHGVEPEAPVPIPKNKKTTRH